MTLKLENKPSVALFAGTFDPFTIGHKSIVDRALRIFDKIVIAVGVNPGKHSASTVSDRIDAISRAFPADTPIEVVSYTGLTAECARRHEATVLLRGVRSASDYDYERTLADINLSALGIDTVILVARPELAMVSSSMVRELAANNVDVTQYLPSKVQ